MPDLSPRDWFELIGWTLVAVTALIIIFSLTLSPYEIVERIVGWIKTLRKPAKRDKKTGRHQLKEDDGAERGAQVAADPSGDGAHQDDEKEAA